MAKLTAAARRKLPVGEFAGAGRSYPVPDRSHAVNAKARATQQYDAGNLSRSAEVKIKEKADRVLRRFGK